MGTRTLSPGRPWADLTTRCLGSRTVVTSEAEGWEGRPAKRTILGRRWPLRGSRRRVYRDLIAQCIAPTPPQPSAPNLQDLFARPLLLAPGPAPPGSWLTPAPHCPRPAQDLQAPHAPFALG
jgi:hypothetical protein